MNATKIVLVIVIVAAVFCAVNGGVYIPDSVIAEAENRRPGSYSRLGRVNNMRRISSMGSVGYMEPLVEVEPAML